MITYGYFSKILNDYVKQEIKDIMKKEIFKVGDRVYHIDHGWGEVTEANNNVLFVLFNIHNKKIMFRNLDKLSFTEYRLQGFSQQRPIELPEVGELCLVRDHGNESWTCGEFQGYRKSSNLFEVKIGIFTICRKHIKRIKILD
jgi:hypothetical protein